LSVAASVDSLRRMIKPDDALAADGPARPAGSGWLTAAVTVAAAAVLARRADGVSVLPTWALCALQIAAVAAWLHWRCGWFGLGGGGPYSGVDRWLTVLTAAAAVDLSLHRGRPEIGLTAMTLFAAGLLLLDAGGRLYERLEAAAACPGRVLRLLAGPWAGMILLTTVLLSLPIATHSAAPDYRHNFWDHILNSGYTAVSAACLVGTSIYGLGDDYSLFGRAIIVVATHLAGLAAAAVGLATVRPFLLHAWRLRTVWMVGLGLEAAAIAVMVSSWRPEDAASFSARLGWGVVHAGAALSNSGLILRHDGLARYLGDSAVFTAITTLAVVGSLGLPVLLDLLLGRRGSPVAAPGDPRNGPAAGAMPYPWHSLPSAEAVTAFLLLLGGAALLWFFETPWPADYPWSLPDRWVPQRPLYFEDGGGSLRDDLPGTRRWTLAVYTSATLRSAGLQSVAVAEGALSWPGFGTVLLWMFLGGGVGGTAGGLRTAALALPVLCLLRRRRWAETPGGESVRRLIWRAVLPWWPVWAAVNAGSVWLLHVSGAVYGSDAALEAVAAVNGVGLSTGVAIHLTWSGRLAMILLMLVGRLGPTAYWLALSDRLLARFNPPTARAASGSCTA